MLISRSIVDKVRKSLNPPGRFLEKFDTSSSGEVLWKEVDTKKALEKTAQALRDGAFPLRKQLSEDFTESGFLEAVFQEEDASKLNTVVAGSSTSASGGGLNGPYTNKNVSASRAPHPLKGHRRRVSAPVIQHKLPEFNADELPVLPDPKRSKPNSPIITSSKELNPGSLLTGINFPSPGASEREFLIGTSHTAVDSSTNGFSSKNSSGRKHHRRNRTFGGYSCSDRHVSDMNVDDIFALFVGSSNREQVQGALNGFDNTEGLFQKNDDACRTGSEETQTDGGIDASSQFGLQNIVTPNDFEQQHTRKQSVGNMGVHLTQLFSESGPSPSPNQEDIMFYAPQPSPSPEMPHLLGQQPQQHELNFMPTTENNQVQSSNKISGIKRHRRYNTIASGHCLSRSNTEVTSSTTSSTTATTEFNLDFLNNINADEPNDTSLNGNAPNGHHQDMKFLDFSNIQPSLQDSQSSHGRHRRMKTTGNIGLPEDWNFTLDKPSLGLNTIHEEVSSINLPHDCASLMSGDTSYNGTNEQKSTSSSHHGNHHKAPSMNTMNAILDSFVPSANVGNDGHTRDMSSKSSLSNEDFCAHLMAGGNWEGMNDSAVDDGFLLANEEEKYDGGLQVRHLL